MVEIANLVAQAVTVVTAILALAGTILAFSAGRSILFGAGIPADAVFAQSAGPASDDDYEYEFGPSEYAAVDDGDDSHLDDLDDSTRELIMRYRNE